MPVVTLRYRRFFPLFRRPSAPGPIVLATSSRMMTAHDADVVPAIGSRFLRVSGGGWQSHLARAGRVAGVARVLTSILIVRTPGGLPRWPETESPPRD